jgi:hypothetical protein
MTTRSPFSAARSAPAVGGALLAQHFDGLVHFGLAHFDLRPLDGLVADAVQLHLRVNLEHRGELQPGASSPPFGSMRG